MSVRAWFQTNRKVLHQTLGSQPLNLSRIKADAGHWLLEPISFVRVLCSTQTKPDELLVPTPFNQPTLAF